MARLRLAPATSGAPNAQLRRSGADLGLAALRSPARAGDRTGKRAAPGLPRRALSRAAGSVLSLAPRPAASASKHGLLPPERGRKLGGSTAAGRRRCRWPDQLRDPRFATWPSGSLLPWLGR